MSTMQSLAKLTWIEIKLFVREPITVVFTLAFPLILLFVLGETFGNTPETNDEGEPVWRGVGPMNYYVGAYVGLVIAAIGVIAIPAHLASYRERGVLRRLRASSVPLWSLLCSQVIVGFLIAAFSGVLLTLTIVLAYDVDLPKAGAQLALAFVLSMFAFAAVGVFLGAALPTARAAQGAGLLLFFGLMFISGAGPPPEEMSEVMRGIGKAMPLWHVTVLLQDAWLDFGWNASAFLIVIGVMVTAAVASVRVFRWE